MRNARAGFAAWIATVALLLLVAAAPAAAQKVALQGARILSVGRDAIDNGTVLIENGKITAIGGPDLEIPFDADVVDVSGKTLFPGLVLAHTSAGMDIPNENIPVTPFVDVYDSIDPSSFFFEDSLRGGVTTIHVIQGNNTVIGGLGRVVHPIGLMVEEMTVKPETALKVSMGPKSGFDTMVQTATLRETFAELQDYLERLAEKKYEEKLEEDEKEIDVLPDEARKLGREMVKDDDLDDKHRNLTRLVEGRLPAFVYCGKAMDVPWAIQFAESHGFLGRAIFVLGGDTFKAVGPLKEAGRPVVIGPNLIHREKDPLTGKDRETFIPDVFAKAEIPFALLADPGARSAERDLLYQAARCVREGIPRDVALGAVTTTAASILELSDRFGAIEEGKDADLLVLTGDPLEGSTRIEKVYISGRLAYDLAEDVRLKELLEGLKPDTGTADSAATKPAEEGEGKAPESPKADEPKPENKTDNSEE